MRGGAWLAAPLALLTLLAGDGARAQEDEAARGELLFNIGGCANCHTAKGGPTLAGGDPIPTPYGTFYGPNITPDPDTGIGGWTTADLARALRQGKSPQGSPYYPAFPYTSYTLLSDADIAALKAYLDGVEPVNQASRPHELRFPYNIRQGLYAWQMLFFEPARFAPETGRGETWNRGAFLVNGPGHCQECHTPRDWAGALDESRAFTGGLIGADDSRVPNITQNPETGIGKWTEDDLVTVLQLGMLPDGDFVGGEMAKVVENATSKLPPEDLQAIITYLESLPAN